MGIQCLSGSAFGDKTSFFCTGHEEVDAGRVALRGHVERVVEARAARQQPAQAVVRAAACC